MTAVDPTLVHEFDQALAACDAIVVRHVIAFRAIGRASGEVSNMAGLVDLIQQSEHRELAMMYAVAVRRLAEREGVRT